jgi:hypothetical protein
MKKIVLLLALTLALGFSQNLLENGDFEQDLSVGWSRDTYGTTYIGRDVGYQPDPDYEALDSLYYYGWSRLYQTVDVPGVTLILDFWAKFEIYGPSSSCWPVASVNLSYLDASNNVLGETRVYCHDQYCTWVPTSTLSLIEVTNPGWNQYTIDVAQELGANLPGVNPGEVSKVTVALSDTTAGG